MFLDEAGVKTNMTRPRGRSFCGERVIESVPHGHWKTTTFLAALRSTDPTAPQVIDGAINGSSMGRSSLAGFSRNSSRRCIWMLSWLSAHGRNSPVSSGVGGFCGVLWGGLVWEGLLRENIGVDD